MLQTSATSNWKWTEYAFQTAAESLGYHCKNFSRSPIKKIDAVILPEELLPALPSRQNLCIECGRNFRMVLSDTPESLPGHGEMPIDITIVMDKNTEFCRGA